MNRLRSLALIAAGLLVALAAGCSAEAAAEPATEQTIVIHHSRFLPGTVTVPAGTPVTIELRNDDPIEHEWIVGSKDVHARHRLGTEPLHDELPAEVTVPALSTRLTTLTFVTPGTYAFICHLPGHEAYGMKGTVKVVR